MKFYQMGNGHLIAEADRGVTKKDIAALQKEPWVKTQGGICQILELTEPRAIYFAENPQANQPAIKSISAGGRG